MSELLNAADMNNEVIKEICRRKKLLHQPRWSDGLGTRLGLVIEGGGMRGVISCGVLAEMQRLGLTTLFDEVYGESAGAINGAYFIAKQAEAGELIYTNDLTSRRFFNIWRPGKLFDMDYAIDEIVGQKRRLNWEEVKLARSKLYVSLTSALGGGKRVVDFQNETISLLTLLKATSAIVPFYNSPVRIGTDEYVDGGIADPVPIGNAIERGCTHILVLLTRPPSFEPQPLSVIERALVGQFLKSATTKFTEAFYSRWRRQRESRAIAFGVVPPSRPVKIAVICPAETSPRISRLSQSRQLLANAMKESAERARRIFGCE